MLAGDCSCSSHSKAAYVQYRMKPTESPMMMPMTAGMGMELTGRPALTPAMKTTASRPSRRVVVKANTQMPHLPDLVLSCTAICRCMNGHNSADACCRLHGQ